MTKFTSLTAVLLLISVACFSQSTETDATAKTEVSKLAFIAGKWAGKGWMMMQSGRESFNQTENVQMKLDSTIVLIEGLGKANGKMIHNALAFITFNKAGGYNFRSYLATGREGQFKAELIGSKIHWYPTENMRYIIELNDKGQWFETGEMNRDGKWLKFFEMTLDKVK
ncbi:hypothetical protein [Mucilaginibacter sp.]|uniref:hypothetical protein n=1 Tax=Mucilaginibacter sp. TaxID=1882438 RepID=UPI003266C0E1